MTNGHGERFVLADPRAVPGGELFPYVSVTGRLEEALARTYFQQLIGVLDHCHKLGIAHRELILE